MYFGDSFLYNIIIWNHTRVTNGGVSGGKKLQSFVKKALFLGVGTKDTLL